MNRAFVPVTDGAYVQNVPSQELLQKKVNGVGLLVGVNQVHHYTRVALTKSQNNANEGTYLVPANITTLDNLKSWMKTMYPTLTSSDVDAILNTYAPSTAPTNPLAPKFATDGFGLPNANTVSQIGTGQQQRAYVSSLPLKLPYG